MWLMIALNEQQPAPTLGQDADGDLGVVEVDIAALGADLPPAAEGDPAAEGRPTLGAESGGQGSLADEDDAAESLCVAAVLASPALADEFEKLIALAELAGVAQ